MSDAFNVTAAYDKPTGYNAGDTIHVAISGDDVQTVVTQQNAGPLDLTLTAADGATEVLHVATVPVTVTSTVHQNVKITSVSDTGTPPRAWTIAADGKSIQGVA